MPERCMKTKSMGMIQDELTNDKKFTFWLYKKHVCPVISTTHYSDYDSCNKGLFMAGIITKLLFVITCIQPAHKPAVTPKI